MVKWGGLLDYDYYTVQLAQVQQQKVRDHWLFDPDPEVGFVPTGSGQNQFFSWFPLQREKPEMIPPRWVANIGGIGCLAGETEINGIPVKELTQSPIRVQTLIGDTWATPAFVKGQANLYRVILRSGKSVLTTAAHRFLSPKGWHQLQDLDCGSLVACHDSKGAAYERETPKGSLDRDQVDFRCGDALPHPLSVFYQEQLQQSSLPFCDLEHILCRQPIANLAQVSDSQHASFQHLSLLAYGESPHRQRQKLCQALYKFLHLCTVGLSRSSANQTDFYFQEESLLGLSQILCKPLKQFHHLLQKSVLFDQDSLFVNNVQRSLDNLLFLLQYSLLQREDHAFQVREIHSHVELLKTLLLNEYLDDRSSSESTLPSKNANLSPSIWLPVNSGNYSNSSSYWDVIEAIEYVRYDDFYDLHVPQGNHYLANGVWHHNSGKTHSGAIWAILQSEWYPELEGLIVSNSFNQLWKSTLVGLFRACERYGVPVDPWHGSVELTAVKIANSQSRFFYLGKKRMLWHVTSMSSFEGSTQTGRGAEYSRIWADEAAYSPESAFQVLDGRLRNSHKQKVQGLITTSPCGFNWLYYRFGDPARTAEIKGFYWMLNFLSLENAHLDDSYVAGLRANYTDEMAKQELEGAFIEVSKGMVYKYFNRAMHTLVGEDAEAIAYDRTLPLHIAFDFNSAPCVAVLAQKRADELHVFAEFFMLDADLWELMLDIREFIKKGNPLNREIHLYGDASGRAKSAVSKMSAWQIVFSELKPLGMEIHKHIPDANPPVRQRVHAVNIIFKVYRCFLAMDSVPELVKDLEQLNWDKDQGIDKTDGLRSHLSDAFGYMVFKMFMPSTVIQTSQNYLPNIM